MVNVIETNETVDQEAFGIIHLAESVLKDKRNQEAIIGLVGNALAHRNRRILTLAKDHIGELLQLEKARYDNIRQI